MKEVREHIRKLSDWDLLRYGRAPWRGDARSHSGKTTAQGVSGLA
jgi:hypothetical protein